MFLLDSLRKRFPVLGPALLLAALLALLFSYGMYTERKNDAMLAKDIATKKEILYPQEREFYIGDPRARIVVLEYFDLECPYCREYHRAGEAHLVNKYKAQGVAFARRHMPLTYLHPYALVKAQALECALSVKPDAYRQTSALLYETPFNGTSTLAAAVSDLLGLEAASTTACIQEGRALPQVAADRILAGIHGIFATPTFIIYKDGIERGRIVGSKTNQIDTALGLLLSED